jgi:hypothetical protein
MSEPCRTPQGRQGRKGFRRLPRGRPSHGAGSRSKARTRWPSAKRLRAKAVPIRPSPTMPMLRHDDGADREASGNCSVGSASAEGKRTAFESEGGIATLLCLIVTRRRASDGPLPSEWPSREMIVARWGRSLRDYLAAMQAFLRSVDLGSFSKAAAERGLKVSTVLRPTVS